jgi:hypothetical protein
VPCQPALPTTAHQSVRSLVHHSAESKVHLAGGEGGPSERFFPFDPYLLKHSSKYLEGLYNYWNEDEE